MVEVKKKKSESFDNLLGRFNRRIMQSGRVLEAKKVRFKAKKKNKNLRKKLALRRLKINSQREYLRKVGKLKEDF